MEWIADPSIWVGLVTQIIELVLGIDNPVFIAILAEKLLPPIATARGSIWPMLAMVMRLLLLTGSPVGHSDSTAVQLPLVFTFSAAAIMLFGGFFLLFKATRAGANGWKEKTAITHTTQRCGSGVDKLWYWTPSSHCTRLELVTRHWDGRPFTGHDGRRGYRYQPDVDGQQAINPFVNSHPTIVILCLDFLLMIGFSPGGGRFRLSFRPGYLYAAIGFSVMTRCSISWLSLTGAFSFR